MELSHYQKDIVSAVKDGTGNILVKAGAGAGKTSTLSMALQELPETISAAFLAFGKENARTLEQRLPKHVHTSTLNSLGFWSVRQAYRNVQLDKGKVWKWLVENYPDLEKGFLYQVNKLVGLAKAYGFGWHTARQFPLLEVSHDGLYYLMNHHDMEVNSHQEQHAIELAETALWANNENTAVIDFDDQIYFPVLFNLPSQKFGFVGIDELQDLSYIQRALVKKIMKVGGRAMGVGDTFQACFGWRGADCESMDHFQHEFNCQILPLSITYRCPKVVVREANTIVPELEAAPWAEEGVLDRMNTFGTKHLEESGNTGVICRNNAPLFRMAMRLLTKHIGFRILGRDFADNLKAFIKSFEVSSIADLYSKLSQWENKEVENCLAHGHEMKANGIKDRADCIRYLAAESANVSSILKLIDDIFSKDGKITLSTVHRGKGLEWDDIFFLDKFLLPSKFARQDWQFQQEKNLIYIATTRTKKRLFYVNSDGFKY